MVGTTGGKVIVLSSDNLTKLGQLEDEQVDRFIRMTIIITVYVFSIIDCSISSGYGY